jgi:hypothetical protein
MRKFAISLTLVTLLAGSAQMTGVALAADIGKSVKSIANPVKSLDQMSEPNDVPNVADLINANKIDGTVDDQMAKDDQFYVNGDSQGDGSFSLEVQKRLLEF